jgi:lipid-A-disaccharide synthase
MDRVGWKKNFLTFFVPDEAMAKKAIKKGIAKHKVKVTGDLMVDSVFTDKAPADFGLDPDKPVITFLPGSRPAHIKFLAPLFFNAAKALRQKQPCCQFVFGLSPYTNALKIEESITKEKADAAAKKYGLFGSMMTEDGRRYIVSEDGTKILLIEKAPFDAMNIADLIITIPGTNTAEAAALGKPMLVVIPFNKPEEFLFEGLLGLMGSIPLLGKLVKQAAISVLNRTVKLIALPNRKAGRMITPEMRGVLTAEEIAEKAFLMLQDGQALDEMEKELKEIMGPSGAAGRIADEVAGILDSRI